MEQEHLRSRLGFILLSAGCSIFFLIILGIPVMPIEFSLGRASKKSPVKLYHALEKSGQKWHLHRYAAMAGNYLLMMFYTTVAGWILHYFFYMAEGTFVGADPETIGNIFKNMLAVVVLSLHCALGYNLLSDFQPRGADSTVLDLEDFLVSNLFCPSAV